MDFKICMNPWFDTHLRWPPVTQSARSWKSYGKIRDCGQSNGFHSNTELMVVFIVLLGICFSGGSSSRSYDSSNTVKSSMCGSKSPFYFTSSYDKIWIRFKSNIFNRGRGFIAGYVLYNSSRSHTYDNNITLNRGWQCDGTFDKTLENFKPEIMQFTYTCTMQPFNFTFT